MLPAEKDTLFNVKLYTLFKTQDPKNAALIRLGWKIEYPWDIYTLHFLVLKSTKIRRVISSFQLAPFISYLAQQWFSAISWPFWFLLCDEKSASFPGQFALFERAKEAWNRAQILLTSFTGEDDWTTGNEAQKKLLIVNGRKNLPPIFLTSHNKRASMQLGTCADLTNFLMVFSLLPWRRQRCRNVCQQRRFYNFPINIK